MGSFIEKRIEQLANFGYDFKLGEYISRGFNLFSKEAGGFIGFTLIFLIMSMAVGFIPIIGTIINYLVITPAVTVGYYLVANKIEKGGNTTFSDFFSGFNHINKVILPAVITMAIALLPLIPLLVGTGLYEWYKSFQTDPMGAASYFPAISPMILGIVLVMYIPIIYLIISWTWAYPLIIFHNMPAWQAMEASRKLVNKKWWIVFGFLIVAGLITAAGYIALCIGVLATMPAMMCAQYAAFADVVGFESDEDIAGDDVLDHFVGDTPS